jgi:hypothetical protein
MHEFGVRFPNYKTLAAARTAADDGFSDGRRLPMDNLNPLTMKIRTSSDVYGGIRRRYNKQALLHECKTFTL